MSHEFQIDVTEIHMFAGETWMDLDERCNHDCPHRALSTIGWGPNRAHYELNHCDICGCRAWRDGRYYIARQSDPSTAQFWLDQQDWRTPIRKGTDETRRTVSS